MRKLLALTISFVWASSISTALISAAPNPGNSQALPTSKIPSMAAFTGEVQEHKVEPHYNKNALRRLDFRIQGKSCAVCLMGIQRRIKNLAGALKVAVMLKKPYGASIIYDASQVDEQTLITTAKLNEPMVKLLDVSDNPIEKIPLVLIPPHSNMQSGDSSAFLPGTGH